MIIKTCQECKQEFISKKNCRKFCSFVCSCKFKRKDDNFKNKMSLKLKSFYSNSTNKKRLHDIAVIGGKKGGGVREGCQKGKQGWYKGYWCNSTWELAWIIYNLDNNIYFERNKRAFHYVFNGKTCKYYPDFIIEGKYIEIKGYENESVKEKIQQFPKSESLIVYRYNEMKPILNYVFKKYGSDLTILYDHNKNN